MYSYKNVFEHLIRLLQCVGVAERREKERLKERQRGNRRWRGGDFCICGYGHACANSTHVETRRHLVSLLSCLLCLRQGLLTAYKWDLHIPGDPLALVFYFSGAPCWNFRCLYCYAGLYLVFEGLNPGHWGPIVNTFTQKPMPSPVLCLFFD